MICGGGLAQVVGVARLTRLGVGGRDVAWGVAVNEAWSCRGVCRCEELGVRLLKGLSV